MEYRNYRFTICKLIQMIIISFFVVMYFFGAKTMNHVSSNIVHADSDIVIVLDPGHGGKDVGAESLSGIAEATYNEKIAGYIAQELENYEGVTVYFTRYEKVGVIQDRHTLLARVQFGKDVDADLFVSLHCNGSKSTSDNGALIILSKGEFKPELNKIPSILAPRILQRFESEVGIKNCDIMLRDSESKYYDYIDENGKRYNADYYGIIRNGVLLDIPTMLIEHGYITGSSDIKILDDDSNLQKLGAITATEIAEYFNLQKRNDNTKPNFVELKPQEELFMSEDIPKTVYTSDGFIDLSSFGGSGNGDIFYESSDWAIFTIEGNKAIIVGNEGSAQITVTKKTDGVYSSNSSKGYTITVKEATATPKPTATVAPTATATPKPTATPATKPTIAATATQATTTEPTSSPTVTQSTTVLPTFTPEQTEDITIQPTVTNGNNQPTTLDNTKSDSCINMNDNTAFVIIVVEIALLAVIGIIVVVKRSRK